MNIKELHNLFIGSAGVTTDSRNCPSGSIFFALKGASFDGNNYATMALEKGCSYAVVDRMVGTDKRLIQVDDVLITLQNLARYHRSQFNIPVIAITGTNGKTTTKELTNAVLRRKFNVLCTQGNLNNHIGVPLTLLNMRNCHEIAIIEMGANHPGEIATLCSIANPNYGLITNVGKAHLEGFGNFMGVIKTKSELYRHLEKCNGKIFINTENHFLTTALEGYNNIVRYDKTCMSMVPCKTMLTYRWSRGIVETHICGEYNYENIIAALTIGEHFKVPSADMHKAISEYVPSNNRSQVTKTDKNTLIVDAYNANPTSMTASIHNFSNLECPNMLKVAILGDMLELGAESVAEHRTILEVLRNSRIERMILVGNEFGTACSETCINDKMQHFATRMELESYLQRNPITNATILIKGSHGMALEKLIDLL